VAGCSVLDCEHSGSTKDNITGVVEQRLDSNRTLETVKDAASKEKYHTD
jgi:hypothetical protein